MIFWTVQFSSCKHRIFTDIIKRHFFFTNNDYWRRLITIVYRTIFSLSSTSTAIALKIKIYAFDRKANCAYTRGTSCAEHLISEAKWVHITLTPVCGFNRTHSHNQYHPVIACLLRFWATGPRAYEGVGDKHDRGQMYWIWNITSR